jgi:hypothetical protein
MTRHTTPVFQRRTTRRLLINGFVVDLRVKFVARKDAGGSACLSNRNDEDAASDELGRRDTPIRIIQQSPSRMQQLPP